MSSPLTVFTWCDLQAFDVVKVFISGYTITSAELLLSINLMD